MGVSNMIQKVPTQYERFLALLNVIGPKYQAGDREAAADLDRLEESMMKAIRIFQPDAEERIGTIISASDPYAEAREACRLRREQESAAWKAECKAAREVVNALSVKYGVADVFLSDTTPELIATELANMVADALTSNHQ